MITLIRISNIVTKKTLFLGIIIIIYTTITAVKNQKIYHTAYNI